MPQNGGLFLTMIFIFDILKRRITNIEKEICKKDAMIDHLTSHLFTSKIISHNDQKNL